jgi:hypothetical protein
MADVQHNALAGASLHQPFHYEQTTDPGAVGASKTWLNTATMPYALKRRNAGDTSWVPIGSTSQGTFNVFDYGAVGDDTTNDSPAFQATVDACTAAGGGTVLVPGGRTYLLVTGIVITSINLTSSIALSCYGAILHYTGSGHGLTVLTNCSGFDGTNCYQYAERATRVSGLHMIGTDDAISGIYLFGVVGGSYRDVVLDGFTSIVEGSAALKLYGEDIYHWVEQNTFENFEIKHTGNGISLYTYDVDLNWVSLANNYFKDINIWVTVAGGRGIDAHRRKWLLIGRCIFEGILVHPFNVENVICFDLGEASLDGTIFISPSVDVYGTPLGTVIWHHIDLSVLVIFQPTYWPRANMYNPGITWKGNPLGTTPETYDTSPYTGGGMYSVLGSYGAIRFSEDGFLTIASTTLPAVGGAVNSPPIGLYGLTLPAEGDWHSHGMQLKTVVNPDGSHHLDIGDGPVAGETEVVDGAFQIDSAGHLALVTRTLPAVGAAEDSPTIGLWGLTQPVAGTYVSHTMRIRTAVDAAGTYRLAFVSGPELTQVEVGFLSSDGELWVKGDASIGGDLWVPGNINAGGNIWAAGSVSGGSSSSIATDTLWDAAGDLAVGSGADTAAKLTKGADGTLLGVVAGAVGWVSALAANLVDGAAIRLANAQWLRARNAANTADVNLIRVNANNVAEIGPELRIGGAPEDLVHYYLAIRATIIGAGDVDWALLVKNVGAETTVLSYDPIVGITHIPALTVDGAMTIHDHPATTYVPLTTPLTSASWNGTAHSTDATPQALNLTTVFGLPANVKAVLTDVGIRDSASATTACDIGFGPNTAHYNQSPLTVGGIGNDMWHHSPLIINTDGNSGAYYKCVASGTNTLDVYMIIIGYWL